MRTLHAPRVNLRRSVILLALSILIAALTSVGLLSRMAFAADAIWNGTELTYDGNTYKKATTPPDRADTPNEYEWRSGSGNSLMANVLYMGKDPGNAQTATLVSYPIDGGTYNTSAASTPQTVTVTRDLTGEQDPNRSQSCGIDGVGWVVCPLSNWLAEGVDAIYGMVSGFLDVQTISTEDNAIYQLWQLIRNIANAVFLIVFLVIIYSQLTGAGYSNYNIKDMIPRLILGAILVNVSFWICAVFVDASNLLGYSVQSILENVRNNYVTPVAIDWSAATAAVLTGGGLAGIAGFAAATGGSISAMGFILLAALISAGLSVLAAFVILAARQALIVVLTAVAPLAFVAFILPSTRKFFDKWQNLFSNMLILFPAFALLFGASQLAGSAIIKTAESATSEMQLALVLIGLTVQVIPLALTPFLTRLSSGILGQIANMTNNKQKGLTDRAKNWSQDNADMHKARKLTNTSNDLERRRNGQNMGRFGSLRGRGVGRMAHRMDQQKRTREAYKKLGEDTLSSMHERDWEARHNRPAAPNRVQSALGMQSRDQRTSDQRHTAHMLHKQAQREKEMFEATGEEHWSHYEASAAGNHYRDLRRETHLAKGRTKVYEDDMTNADELALKALIQATPNLRVRAQRAGVNAKAATAYQDSLDADVQEEWINTQDTNVVYRNLRQNADLAKKRADDIDKAMSAADQRIYDTQVNQAATPVYARVRDAKVQTVEDTKMAQFQASEVEAEGERAYRRLFEDGVAGSRDLRKQNVRVEQLKKETAEIESTLQKRADAHWEHQGLVDQDVQTLRLRNSVATDAQKRAELQWSKLVEDARRKGSDTAGVIGVENANLASNLQTLMVGINAEESAIDNIKDEQKALVLDKLYNDAKVRQVAGGGTKFGETKVTAKAQQGITKMHLENVKAQTSVYSNDGYRVDEMIGALLNENGTLRGQPADIVAQHAAIQYVMEDQGNNWAVQKMVDLNEDQQSMELYEKKDAAGNKTGEVAYYDARAFRQAMIAHGGDEDAAIASLQELSDSEVGNRRDFMQMVVGGYRNGKNKVSWLSATTQERFNRGLSNIDWRLEAKLGREVDASEAAIISEINAGKYEAKRISELDPDELSRMIQILRDDNVRKYIGQEKLDKVRDKIITAQSSELYRDGIKDRERSLMDTLASYLYLGENDNPNESELRDIETHHWQVTETDADGRSYRVWAPPHSSGAIVSDVDSAAPNIYSWKRQDDIGPSGTGRRPPR